MTTPAAPSTYRPARSHSDDDDHESVHVQFDEGDEPYIGCVRALSPDTVSQPVKYIRAQTSKNGRSSGPWEVPATLLHGKVLGWLNQIRSKLGSLFPVLLEYASYGNGDITAAIVTLAGEVGVDRKTMRLYMRLLCDGDEAVGLPSLLLKVRIGHWRFKKEGLYALTAFANGSLAKKEERLTGKSLSCQIRGRMAAGIPKQRGFLCAPSGACTPLRERT